MARRWGDRGPAASRRGSAAARRRADRQLVEISGEVRHETEAAVRWHDGCRLVWLPKSLAEVSDDGETVSLPQWLAHDKGLI